MRPGFDCRTFGSRALGESVPPDPHPSNRLPAPSDAAPHPSSRRHCLSSPRPDRSPPLFFLLRINRKAYGVVSRLLKKAYACSSIPTWDLSTASSRRPSYRTARRRRRSLRPNFLEIGIREEKAGILLEFPRGRFLRRLLGVVVSAGVPWRTVHALPCGIEPSGYSRLESLSPSPPPPSARP